MWSKSEYLQKRNHLVQVEKNAYIGGGINLTEKEVAVNKILLKVKNHELESGYKSALNFLPSQHFFKARKAIDKSKIFSIIKRIPKGTSLHTHMLAAVSIDFLIENITYQPHLYGCEINGIFKLKFIGNIQENSEWKLLNHYRQENPDFDKFLRGQISLEVDNPQEVYPSDESIWKKFKKSFSTCYDMICYQPVFEVYIYRLLQELYDDNIFYTELKGTFMPLYDLNGTIYDSRFFIETFIGVVTRFRGINPDFIGVRYIHSIYRGVSNGDLEKGLKELIEMKKLFPDFIIGFDFVGYEEEGRSILDYSDILLKYSRYFNLYFHAGETNWFGHTDLNMIDAILLNCKRIGHAFALTKHPTLMELVKERNIAIEVCPISNQVLMLNADPRNHPAASFMANGLPIVICNDDPALWGASGLSYDWYVAFMAMTPKSGGVEVLKQLAINSMKYSGMDEIEKKRTFRQWEEKWEAFLDWMLRKRVEV